MAAVVNVYLGGTGKYIAGLLKARSAMYGAQRASTLVFDTDTADLQTRAFQLGGELRTPGAGFGTGMHMALTEWAECNLDSICAIVDSGGDFDTAMAPHKAAVKLLPENRASGGGMWTLRAHGHPALGRYLNDDEPTVGFLRDVENAVTQQAANGQLVRVNIIASIAGGTGSGIFLPTAFKLRERLAGVGLGIHAELSLYVILPSAFYKDWGPGGQGAPTTAIMTRTRGMTGAFAAWRELQFFLGHAEPNVVFPPRTIPLLRNGSQTVSYEPSSPLAGQVYWAGMRSIDPGQRSHALFDEVGRALAVMSDPVIDGLVSGQAIMHTSGAKLCWSATCIEYPLLELAQKFSAAAVARALDRLAGTDDDPTRLDTFYREFASRENEHRPLSRFLTDERQGVLADGRSEGSDSISDHDGHLSALLGAGPGASATETLRQKQSIRVAYVDGFSGEGAEWDKKAQGQCQSLDTALNEDVASLKKFQGAWLDQELQALNAWLASDAVERPLSAGDSAQSVLNTLGSAGVKRTIHGELERVRTLFSRPFGGLVAGGGNADRFRGVAHCQSRYATSKNELVTPPPGRRIPGFWRVLIVLAGSALAGWGIWSVFDSVLQLDSTVSVIGALLGVGLALWLLFWLTGWEESDITRRERAEDRLFQSYNELLLAHAGEQLWGPAGTVCQRLLTPVLGPPSGKKAGVVSPAPVDAGSLGSAKHVLEDLQTICRKARDESDALAQQALRRPPDVAVWVGDQDDPGNDKRQEHIELVRQHLHVVSTAGGNARALTDLQLRIGEANVGRDYGLGELLQSFRDGAEETEKARWKYFTDNLQEEAWQIVRTELGLPNDLAARLLRQAGGDGYQLQAILADYLIQMVQRQQRRGAAIASEVAVPPPSLLLLVVKDAAMQALVGQALGHNRWQQYPNELATLRQSLKGTGANATAFVSSSVGEAITLLALYDVPNVARVMDVGQSQRQYYSTGEPIDTAVPPVQYCAGNSEFQLLPEVSAAAAIEFSPHGGNRPLHPMLIPHLLGSDPDYPGPTSLCLFYLARQQHWLERQTWTIGGPQRYRWVIANPAQDGATGIPLLVETLHNPITADPAGTLGRVRLLDPLDATNDFLHYDGQPPAANTVCRLSSGSQVCVADWPTVARGLRDRQRELRELWWDLYGQDNASKRRTCLDEMEALLRDDLALIPVGDLCDSWERACRANFAAAARVLEGL